MTAGGVACPQYSQCVTPWKGASEPHGSNRNNNAAHWRGGNGCRNDLLTAQGNSNSSGTQRDEKQQVDREESHSDH